MRPGDEPLTECCPRRLWGDGTCELGCKGENPGVDALIAKSSIGAGLRDIDERGIDAHLADLEQEIAPKKKRRKGTSPTARTLAECRRRGWIAGVVERHIPFPRPQGTKIDLFGVIDLIVIVPPIDRDGNGWPDHGGILAIQATGGSGGHHAERRAKILAEPRAAAWVASGGRLELWSWSPLVARNKDGSKAKVRRFALRVETYAEMLAASEARR